MYNPPPFNPEATIDIYGFDEYPIKDYDAIWLMNMNNNYLPGISQNKTFLPNKIKEKYHINDEEYDKKLLNLRIERITKATSDITFSYSEDFDDINLFKTPLPKFLEIVENTIEIDVKESILNDDMLEYIDDFNAPPFPKDYSQNKYGRNILNAQLICPAWAFFEYRLGLGVNEDDLQEEISSLTIGNMVHEILEVFWGEVKSQDNLLKLSNKKVLNQKIINIVEKIIYKYKSTKPFCSDIHFKIEKTKLIKLISKWLEYEANRGSAFDIFELEKKFSVNLNQFQFNIKVDRIDIIEKDKIIIDYKTGAINSKEALYDKSILNDIQLPLYACFTHNDIKGVAYAQLKSNKPRLTGISANHLSRSIQFNIQPNSPINSWDKLKSMWSELLNETAEEYIKGFAAIKFKDIKKLEYCNVKSILRLPERTFQFEEKEKSK
jgi:exodeoxyribonuclease-5